VAVLVINLSVTLALGLAANTSFGGLPVLLQLVAKDQRLPHLFALRAEKPVLWYGVATLAILAAAVLLIVKADTQRLLPVFAIGVFIGFTISQTGLVRHWRRERGRGWRAKAALNGTGAVLTAVAGLVLIVAKFREGAWLVVVIVPVLMLLFDRVERYYRRIAEELGLGRTPAKPVPRPRCERDGHRAGRGGQPGRAARVTGRHALRRRGSAGRRRHRPRRHTKPTRGVGAMEPRRRVKDPAQPTSQPGGAHRRVRAHPNREGSHRHRAHRRGGAPAAAVPAAAQPTRPHPGGRAARPHRRRRRHHRGPGGLIPAEVAQARRMSCAQIAVCIFAGVVLGFATDAVVSAAGA
jgi:Amino acid permease